MTKLRFFNKLLCKSYLAIVLVIFVVFFLVTIIITYSLHSVLVSAQKNVGLPPQSFVINSSMISNSTSFPAHFVVSPKNSGILSYVVMSHSFNISSPMISHAAFPSIQMPSFNTMNITESISYNTLTGIRISSIIEHPAMNVSKATLLGNNSLNIMRSDQQNLK